jgi:RNA polymerase sigma-70 factor (ECF subfamily)
VPLGSAPDDSGFDDFFVFDYPKLVAALTLLTGDGEVARDAVDEAAARAWEAVRRGKRIESLPAWVRVVALNVARGRYRRRAAERRATERLRRLTVHTTVADAGVAIDTHRALLHLPRRQREVVVMHYFLDLPVDDIATQLGITAGTVKTSLHRARQALADVLGDGNDHDEVLDGIA